MNTTTPSTSVSYSEELSEAIQRALITVHFHHGYATKTISEIIKEKPEWNDQMRAQFSQDLYAIVRNWILYWGLLGKNPTQQKSDLQDLITIYRYVESYSTYLPRTLNKKTLEKRLHTQCGGLKKLKRL